jgi:adenine-specific DNA-methyltransferase
MAELIWDGKYDEHHNKRAPVRIELPFQTVETVNESAQERQRTLELSSSGHDPEWRNRLIWGDKKYVLPSLLPEFAGKVGLIYIDPPFGTGSDFSFTAMIPSDTNGRTEFTKEPSMIEQKAYRDTWGRGLDSYIEWFSETIILLHELLIEAGSLFVHLDDNLAPYAKVVLDEVFGMGCYQSEVIWQRTDAHNDARYKYGNIHDTIYWFGKSNRPRYYPETVRTALSAAGLAEYSLLERSDGTIVPYAGNENAFGRRFKLDDATWRGANPKKKFTWRGATPSQNREWMYTLEEMEQALAKGELFLRDPSKGAARCKKSYLDINKGIYLQDIWTDAGRMKGGSSYATEKPEPLVERIVKSCTGEGDLILDSFCGSGTTAAVAEKLNRRWIACDLGRFAIHTPRASACSASLA